MPCWGDYGFLGHWGGHPDGGGRCARNSRPRSLPPDGSRPQGQGDKDKCSHKTVSWETTVLHSAGSWMIKVRLTHAMECCMFVKMNITYMYSHELPNWKTLLTNLQKNVLECYLQETYINQNSKRKKAGQE